ncbi:MAG: BglG family transcription antiterminator [Anaerostipes sp.]|nr:BglG family transcription antiterminator [Anaerostipes sp.]
MEVYNKRLFKILFLFLQTNKKLTGDSIALSVGVSSRTVRNDVKELNKILIQHSAEIIAEAGQGYYLKVKEEDKFGQFISTVQANNNKTEKQTIIPSDPEDRIRYIVTKLLLNSLISEGKIESFDIEEELYISTSTLNKDMRVVEKQLHKYGLKVSNTKRYGLRVVGEEAKIRYAISEYIFNNKSEIKDKGKDFYQHVFSEEATKRVEKILMQAIEEYKLQLSDLSFKNLLVHSLIMLKRFKNKKMVRYAKEDIELFSSTEEFNCAKCIIKEMNYQFQIKLGEEVYYLTQHLIASQRFLIDDPEEEYEYKEELQEILQEIKAGTNIDLSDDKQLINGLAMHLSAALQRLRFDMNIRNEFLDSIKNSYPLAFELAVVASNVLEKKHQLRSQENEIGFLAMHFGAALERKGLNRQIERKKVVIVCVAGVATAMLLKEKIQHNFGHRIQVVRTCSLQDVSQELIDSVDMVFTTIDLPQFHSKKIRKIKLFLQDTDLEQLGIYINEQSGTSQRVDYHRIFRKELFFKNMEFKTKQEILDYMTSIVKEKGFISEGVRQSIYKREEMATTELGSLVAIPHALLNDMEEAVVSVMILKKPIFWDEEKVQVILLLNIPQSKSDVWEIVFKNLYQYLINDSGVTKLIRNESYEQFIQELIAQDQNEYRNGKWRI